MNKDFLTSYKQVRWKYALESHKRCVTMLALYAKHGMAPQHDYWSKKKLNLEMEFPALKGVTHNESI